MNLEFDVSTALAGVRVVSTALNLPGPACLRRLVELGADVVKIEPPAGDPMRGYSARYYEALHRGLDVRVLDLKSEAGRATLDSLLTNADILLTAQRFSALERLGLGWEALHARFPRLCHIAIAGDAGGETAGHDLTYVTAAGLASPPQLPRTLLADLAGAERAVQAVFAALRLRDRAESGQRLVVALDQAAQSLAEPLRLGLTGASDLIGGAHPGYNFYLAQDGWIALAALEKHFVARIETLFGFPLTQEALRQAFARETREHWRRWADENDIPLAVVP